LDSLSGTLLATVEVPQANGETWVTVTSPVVNTGGRHNIYLVYKDNYKIDNFRFLKKGTGIENVTLSSPIKLYPNPANDRLFVKFPYSGQLTVYDVFGKQILFSDISEGITNLNIGNYVPGIYFVNINTTAGRFTDKFLKE
jgi:hypothetical protein